MRAAPWPGPLRGMERASSLDSLSSASWLCHRSAPAARVCGSGSRAIAPNALTVQAYMFGVLAFAMVLVLNVVEELRNPRKGAYNVDGILGVMVGGLERELEERLDGKFWGVGVSPSLPARGDLGAGSATARGGSDGSWRNDGGTIVGYVAEGTNGDVPAERARNAFDDVGVVSTDRGGDVSDGSSTSRRRRVKDWLRRNLFHRLSR